MLSRKSFFFSKKSITILITGLLFIALFSGGLYAVTGKTAKDPLIGKILSREQLAVEFGVNSIESFLELTSHSVVLMADHFGEDFLNQEKTRKNLQEFTSNYSSSPAKGAMIANKNGDIVFLCGQRQPKKVTHFSENHYCQQKKMQLPST